MASRNRPSSSLVRIGGPHLRRQTSRSDRGKPAAQPTPRNLRTLFLIFSGPKELFCELVEAYFGKFRPSGRVDEPPLGELVVLGVRRREPTREAAEAPGPAQKPGPAGRARVGPVGRRFRIDRRSLRGRFEGGSRHLEGSGVWESLN